MRKILIFLFLIFISNLLPAESSPFDSLQTLVDNSNGEAKIDAMNALAKAFWEVDPEKTLEYSTESRKIAKRLKYLSGEAEAIKNLGVGYYYLGDPETGIDYLLESLELRKKIGNKEEIIIALNNIGIIYDAMNNIDKALQYYLESLTLEEEIGNKSGIAGSLNNIGLTYKNQSNFNKALEYSLRSLQLYKEIEDKVGIASNLTNIGIIYGDLTNYDKALEALLQALDIYEELQDENGIAVALGNIGSIYDGLRNNEMALDYYLRALEIEEKVGENYGIAGSLNNIGIIYDDLGNYEKAIEYYQRALDIYEEINDVSGMANASNNLGVTYQNMNDLKKALEYLLISMDSYRELGEIKGIAAALTNVGTVYYKLRNYEKAEQYLKDGLVLAEQIEIRDLIIEIYQRLSDVKVAQHDFETALNYHKLYSSVKDSIFSKERLEIIAGMEATYEVQLLLEEREKEIELLQKNNEIYMLKAQKQKLTMWLLYFGFAIVVVLAFVVYYRYRLNKKVTVFLEKQVEERTRDLRQINEQLKNEIAERKQLENQLIRSERLAGVGVLAAGIAHEIRNPLGNISSSAQICLSKYDPKKETKEFLEIIQEESEKANAIIKGLLDFANPREVKLKKGSICKVIKNVLNSVNARCLESKIEVEMQCPSTLPRIMLDEKWLEQAFQNLILNAIQAMPQGGELKISASADFNHKELTVKIKDTGVGISKANLSKIFDPFYTTREDGVGLGLSLCHQIITDHNGKMQVESAVNKGTTIKIGFPISNN
ncbi:MAG: tetratricopeptide repeat protein [Candidatus Cloacimonadales bacterium]|nr:tetratricopeptide repeat protein [Candidatus Cloacimonadales bacterium]